MNKHFCIISKAELSSIMDTAVEHNSELTGVFNVMPANDSSRELLYDFHSQPQALPYKLLFLGTAYEELLRSSPYYFKAADHRHNFVNQLINKHQNWGFFALGHHSIGVEAKHGTAHWQSLLNAVLPDDKITHFRFYSSGVLAKLIPACTETELIWLLGPYTQLFIPLPEDLEDSEGIFTTVNSRWLHVSNPKKLSSEKLIEAYVPQSKVWWQVSSAHLEVFKDTFKKTTIMNITQWLWEVDSELAFLRHKEYKDLETFVTLALQKAEKYELKKDSQLNQFVLVCLKQGLDIERKAGSQAFLEQLKDNPEFALNKLATL